MFAVVHKMYGCARTNNGEEWTFDPEQVIGFTQATANAFADPDYHRVEPLDTAKGKLTMAGTTRGRKPKQSSQASALVEALGFVSVAAARNNVLGVAASHVRMSGKMVVSYDGQISAGYPIAEEINLCPQIDHFAKALARSGKTLVISETPGGKLSVKGEKLNALVPCLAAETLPPVWPDPQLAPADDRIKAAFRCCGALASEKGNRLIEASLLLRANDCTGTNGAAIIQFWHGVDLPPDMVLPKIFCAAVAAVKATIVGFGASWNDGRLASVTFYFEGGAWLKTVCYADKWPDISRLWAEPSYSDVPEGLFEAIDTVDDFHDKGYVYFFNNSVQSHPSLEIGAQYSVPGLQGGKCFAGKLMKQVAPWASKMDLTTDPEKVFFMGGEAATPIRGIVMAVLENQYREPPKDPLVDDPFIDKTAGEIAAEFQADPQHAPIAVNGADNQSSPASPLASAATPMTPDMPQGGIAHGAFPSEGGWSSPAPGGFTPSPSAGGSYDIDDDVPFTG